MMIGAGFYQPIVVNAANLIDFGEFEYPDASGLHSALDYGAFATDTFTVNNDIEANFAANTLNYKTSHYGGVSAATSWMYIAGYTTNSFYYFNNVTNVDNYAGGKADLDQKYWPIMLIGTGTTFTNDGTSVTLTSDGKSIKKEISQMRISDIQYAKDTTYSIDFAKAATGLTAYSEAQYKKADHGVTVSVDSNNNNQIDIVCDAGDDIVNINYTDFIKQNAQYSIYGQNSTTDYSLTINITGLTAEDKLFDTPILIDGKTYGQAERSPESARVLFNLGPTFANLAEFQKTALGNVLAPNASVKTLSSHNGSIFAKNIRNDNSEIHQSYFRLILSSITASIPFKKTVNGNTPSDTEKFTFNLEKGTLTSEKFTSDATPNIVSTTTNNSGNVNFSQAYTTSGTYYYKAYETVPTGYQSNSVFYVKVVVDVTAKKAVATVYSDDAFTKEVTKDSCVFKNTKDGTTTPAYGSAVITKHGITLDGKVLGLAHFVVYKQNSSPMEYYVAPTASGAAATWTTDLSSATVLETADDGTAKATGLAAGDYAFLEQAPAPRGYQVDSTPITFTISEAQANGTDTVSATKAQADQLVTPYGPGSTNPDTGDRTNASYWFFLFGCSMAVAIGCAWILKTKKAASK